MKHWRWAFGAALSLALVSNAAQAQETVGPYFMVVVDNSGSMTASTGGGTNSCGLPQNRMSDAKCVLQDVVNGYGEAVFGLERFRHTCSGSGSCSSSTCDDSCGDAARGPGDVRERVSRTGGCRWSGP